jgi:predicted ribosome quality control (RQC) complex YloA/Tae2 family protein
LAREILVRADYPTDLRAEQADADRLWQGIQWLLCEISNNSCFVALQEEGKGNFEFSLVDIAQYGAYVKKTVYPSAGALLDEYYAARARESVVQARGADLKKTVQTQMSRLSRKLTVLQADCEENRKKEKYRSYGDLITANIYRIREGDAAVTALDYTDPACPEVTIELDKDLPPAANAQRYYKIYRKAKTAIEHLIVEQEKAAKELQYLESVLDALSRAETGAEVSEIREELTRGGYLRTQGKKTKPQKALPHKFIFGGTEILAGKNNLQNEQLTHHVAQKNEWWLHRLEAPGSHVIVRDADADEPTLTFAAQVAALYSAGDQAGKTAVDLTRARYVKKIPGAGPGMVTYTNQTTLYVTPNRETVEKYRVK